MSSTPPRRIRYRWPDIAAALITCAVFAALPLIILNIAAERIAP